MGTRSSRSIVISYAIFGFLWILTTDRLLLWLLRDPALVATWQTYKGWLFVAVSTLFIYAHLSLAERNSRKAQRERDELLERVQIQAAQMAQVVASVPQGIALLDKDRRVLLANPVAEHLVGKIGVVGADGVLTHLGDSTLCSLFAPPQDSPWHEIEEERSVYQVIARAMDSGPVATGWLLVINDVTQERSISAQMQQQERLAAVGQMAAGIAHDFNNILSVIVIYAGAMMQVPNISQPVRDRLLIIHEQALRAAHMIGQILDFSRSSVMQRHPLDLLSLVKEQKQLLDRILPENIEVQLSADVGDYVIDADVTRITQVLMNLAVNARDAMPQGGKLALHLSNVLLDDHAEHPSVGMGAGCWVCLRITDSGVGIDDAVIGAIFDPFFTTKAPGEGTGLGLAQVHGIVTQHQGHITVSSKLGHGSSFALYFPTLRIHDDKEFAQIASLEIPAGRGEHSACRRRRSATQHNVGFPYTVGLLGRAPNGADALTQLAATDGSYDLVISDVIMPKVGGVGLYLAIREQFPTLPVILISGYPQVSK
ncbi:MAG: ATP-binding protein [Caldilineaceae bacterium]